MINTIKYSFRNDYSEGAHENIIKSLVSSNLEQTDGYGYDPYCEEAKKLIKGRLNNEESDIHFLVGGTQTNLIMISSALRPFESVIAANTGHINVHETGAIEATGHKVCGAPFREDGKLRVKDIQAILDEHVDEHMVMPKMVYISQSTEVGTIYTKAELKEIYNFCQSNELILFVDGARLGSALASYDNDMTLEDLAHLSDAFYIGATKNGALLGEALIINNKTLSRDFRYYIKQRGALLAKGRVIGIQFVELFKNELFFELGKHANDRAMQLKRGLVELGVEFLTDSPTNQIFPIISNENLEILKANYDYTFWSKVDESRSCIRLCTSWATREDMVNEFLSDFNKILNK
ncbi:MAG: threonine aldolase family protein [Sarcina sp.]